LKGLFVVPELDVVNGGGVEGQDEGNGEGDGKSNFVGGNPYTAISAHHKPNHS
jgi:hypothetical protein